jgi:hypothetical protein
MSSLGVLGCPLDTIPLGSIVASSRTGEDDPVMMPIARFPTLDDAESALDWIGVEFGEGDEGFEGELAGDDRDLLEAAIEDAETPEPVRDLARALLARWDADGVETLPFAIAWDG